MAEADALEGGGQIPDAARDEALVAAALVLARQTTEDAEELVATILRQRRQLRAGEVASPMADELNKILEMLQRIDTRVSLLERDREDAVPGPRVKLFVTEVISPIKESVGEIKNSMKTMADESRELYEAHKAFINAEQRRKEAEAQEKTLGATLKRWGAISAAVGSILVLLRVAGTALEIYIQSRGGK